MSKITAFFTELMRKYLPDPFVFAILLTLLTMVLAFAVESRPVNLVVEDWGKGFWSLLAGACERCLNRLADKGRPGELSMAVLPALSARLIKVVNSPLLRATQEVTDLHTAITRLGINYSSNLAIGLVMEQIFHARSEVVEQKMREVWRKSLEIAGVSYALCRHCTQLKPDQAALGGLVHQIGVLPILTYAEDHYDLLSDPVSLNHVIERIHPLLGDKLLQVWEFPEMLLKIPGQYQDFSRQTKAIDYIDLVQIATVFKGQDIEALDALHAFKKLKVDADDLKFQEQLHEACWMFI